MINTEECLEHILKLLRDSKAPELPKEYAELPSIVQIHEDLKTIREILRAFSSGDFSPEINIRGIIPGCLKSLQANLNHLVWQVQMVEKGDFTQKVHFMGEFSNAFNRMVHAFGLSISKLRENEESLAAMNDNLKFLASYDALTGALNRRSFIEKVEIELANAAYLCIPCCLAMMDIDHFKNFNDTYGHLAGDEALRHVVKTIESGLRKNDFMGRYGGEEFIIFFYNTDGKTALKALERLRLHLSKSPVPLAKGPVEIHASFGLVAANGEKSAEKEYVQSLIHSADTALYSAKVSGRNMVVVFSQEMDFNLNI